MDEIRVATCFLREAGDVLLLQRGGGSYPGRWGGITGRVATDADPDREPSAAARAGVQTVTGGDATLVRAGDPVTVDDEACDARWAVYPFLFDCDAREIRTGEETADAEWAPPTAMLRRDTVPGLWTCYDCVRPRVATVREDGEHGAAWISVRALEVLRDEAGAAASGDSEADCREVVRDGEPSRHAENRGFSSTSERERERSDTRASGPERSETAERDGDDWAALVALACDLRDARPSMTAVGNRVARAVAAADEERTPRALETAAGEEIKRALSADGAAAALAADRIGDRIATLSRSGTVLTALRAAGPEAVLVAESRPGREGVGVAEELADEADVTLTTDAALAQGFDAWDADALLVGADRILPDGRVVNKIGTRGAALAAPTDCPCYVVAASDKVATDERVDSEERDAGEVYDGGADIAVANPTFDVTPAGAVDAVVTERGVLDADEIRAVADEHRERAALLDSSGTR